MSASSDLDKYSAAVAALKEHQAENKPIFDAHQKLVFNVIDAENSLRDSVAELGAGLSNGDHQVNFIPQTQTWGDIETIDQLIAEGKIPKELRDQIVKTQPRPPRITISEQKN